MTTAEEYNAKGNDLVMNGKIDEAIATYTEGIKQYDTDYELYTNRSAAYHAKGNGFDALKDAKKALELNPNFVKAYSRKAEALHYLKRFKEAIATYEEGLERFPGDEYLQAGLENIQIEQTVTKSARGRRASVVASLSAQRNTKEAQSISEFVLMARATLEFEIAAKQAQLRILNSVAKKTDADKMKLLFSILDKDGDGAIDAQELSDGVRKRHEEFDFADSLDRAMDLVALFDQDKDAKLNFDEFKKFVDSMLESMGVSFHEFAEFLIMQMLFTEGNDVIDEVVGLIADPAITAEVKARGDFYDALLDKRMMALFQLFDLDGDGAVDFMEVALGMYQFTNDMEESAEAAMGVLLTFDQDNNRALDYTEFAQLMMNIAAASGKKFDEIADSLTLAMLQDEIVDVDDLKALTMVDAIFQAALDEAEAQRDAIEAMGALQYAKLHKLFDLWDADHDGFISFDELLIGMRRFQAKQDIEDSIQQAALVMIGFDEDGNQKLDRIEFAVALVEYAKAVEADVLDLIDFMCVASVLIDDDEFEKSYIKAIGPAATKQIAAIENEM